jgi:CBS domain-containing protein
MTTSVKTVKESASSRQALELMHEGRFRHLPLVDDAGQVLGMISVRDLLRVRIGELDQENEGLMSYISADGPGG